MAGSLNKVTLIGNLGADPVTNSLNNGGKVTNFNVATTESWKDKATNERKDRTEWHRVVIFNSALADIASSYLKKGSKVYVEGQLQTRKWQDKDGVEKYTTEIVLQNFNGNLVLLDSRGGEGAGSEGFSTGSNASWDNSPSSTPADLDDDIPF